MHFQKGRWSWYFPWDKFDNIRDLAVFLQFLIRINQLFVERYLVGLILWFCTCCGCKLVCKIEILCKLLKIWFQNFSKIARYRIDRWYLTTLMTDWLIWSKAIGITNRLIKLMTVLWTIIDLRLWEVKCKWKRITMDPHSRDCDYLGRIKSRA